ncbi:uncharacterized protein NEMAJ01_1439, partial [Nematocida major]|uniref:uncharacterized protein n=1 Tax=Nematocida major TaxID=1912982 RepID=UPI002007B130
MEERNAEVYLGSPSKMQELSEKIYAVLLELDYSRPTSEHLFAFGEKFDHMDFQVVVVEPEVEAILNWDDEDGSFGVFHREEYTESQLREIRFSCMNITMAASHMKEALKSFVLNESGEVYAQAKALAGERGDHADAALAERKAAVIGSLRAEIQRVFIDYCDRNHKTPIIQAECVEVGEVFSTVLSSSENENPPVPAEEAVQVEETVQAEKHAVRAESVQDSSEGTLKERPEARTYADVVQGIMRMRRYKESLAAKALAEKLSKAPQSVAAECSSPVHEEEAAEAMLSENSCESEESADEESLKSQEFADVSPLEETDHVQEE